MTEKILSAVFLIALYVAMVKMSIWIINRQEKTMISKILCKHEWTIFKTYKFFEDSSRPYKITEVLVCSKCGKIKKVTIDG